MTARIQATEADTRDVQRRLARMPFAGSIFAPHVKAVEYDPLPPINARGGRDVEGWTAVYEAVIQEDWINGMGGLHGAASAFLVDMLTGSAFARLRTETWSPHGPSANMELNYYAAAPAGTRMRIEVTVDRMGGSLCTARCLMMEWNSGRRIMAGMHTTMKPSGGRKRASKL